MIDFKLNKDEKQLIAVSSWVDCKYVLDEENINYSEKVVAELLMKYFPDYRRTLNELQRYSKSGIIDEGILSNIVEVNIKGLVDSLKDKDFKKMRQWVANNVTLIHKDCIVKSMTVLWTRLVIQHTWFLLIADYQYKSALL